MSDELAQNDDTTGGPPSATGGATAAVAAPTTGGETMVTVREDVLTSAAVVAGFVAGAGGVGAALGLPFQAVGLGRRNPVLKGPRMRNRRLQAQLAPAMYSLAATNSQLLGLIGHRRPLLAVAKLGVAAAAVAYFTADEAGKKAMIDQATGLAEQGANLIASSGLLDVLKK